MGTVLVLTAERMLAIEAESVVSGAVSPTTGHLILTHHDGSTIDAGKVTAENLADASDTVKGIVRLATDAETIAGTLDNVAVTPQDLAAWTADGSRQSTKTKTGYVELATAAETLAGVDDVRAVTPADLLVALLAASAKNRIVNGGFRQNQRAYSTGVNIPIGTYCFDRWMASGRVNLALDPRGTTTSKWLSAVGTLSALTGLTIGAGAPASLTTAIRTTLTSTAAAGGLYHTSDITTPYAPVVPGRFYRASAWVRSSNAKSVGLDLQWYSAAGGNLGSTGAGAYNYFALAANTWTRVTKVWQAPLLAARCGIFSYAVAAGVVGQTYDMTGVMLEEVLPIDLVTGNSGTPLREYFDGSMTDCSWLGTANASNSYSVPNVIPALTFTADPHGQAVSLNTGARVQQIIERNNIGTGVHTIAHDGTAQVRAYNNNSSIFTRPAFAAGPIQVTVDGTDDLIVEFSAVGVAQTISNVRIYSGALDYGFRSPDYSDELRECQRYYRRILNGLGLGIGWVNSLNIIAFSPIFEIPMRAVPQPYSVGAMWFTIPQASLLMTITNVYIANYLGVQGGLFYLTCNTAGFSGYGQAGSAYGGPGANNITEFDAELK